MEINKIIYFMSKLAEIKEINELVIHSSIITNGYLLNKEVFDKLMISNINTLQITIDGIGEKHDVHRHLANGGKTFDVIIKNHNIKIFIRNNNDAKSNLKEFIDYFYKFFKDDKRFIFDFHPIGDWKTTFSDIPKHQINNELYDYIKYAYALGLRVRSLEDDSMFAACLCQANYVNSIIVNHKRQIMKCTILLDWEKNIIGKLESGGDIIYNENCEVWENNKGILKCKECSVFPVCLGRYCPHIDKTNCSKSIKNAIINNDKIIWVDK